MDSMEEIGVIKTIRGEQAEIEIDPSNLCGTCANKEICQLGESSVKRYLWARNPVGAGVGDLVQVEVEPGKAVLSAFLIFIFPLIALIAGYLLLRPAGEGLGILGAFGGFGAGLLLVRAVDRLYAGRKEFQPAVTKVLEHCPIPAVPQGKLPEN
ncbi:MAG TPA: hypothetical protein ENJ23_03110 [Bacteroidetes bacterium]|nr:hypothetical protein [Bacteroidota bacterium]